MITLDWVTMNRNPSIIRPMSENTRDESDIQRHCMLDLETLAVRPHAAIVAIGAAAFSRQEGIVSMMQLPMLNINDGVPSQFDVDISTLDWWSRQSDEVKFQGTYDISNELDAFGERLNQFTEWFQRYNCRWVWGNGATFDNVILRHAYDVFPDKKAPWSYRDDRCFRTLANVFNINVKVGEFEGTPHIAAHDAVHQAKCLLDSDWKDERYGD